MIQAFNDDLPYDQFLLYQIAGDQVRDEEGQRPLAAMGFLTLGQRFANVRQEIINDRIDVIARATMALTVTCARCHDHPADPISMADYYSLYGVFAGSSERLQSIQFAGARTEAFVTWEKELRKREKAYQDYFQQKTAELLNNLRANTQAYLAAVLEAGKLPPDEFYQVLGQDDIRPFLVRRWERYIHQEKFRQGIHPIFGAWHAFASISESELAARAPTWLKTHVKRLNPRVAEVFERQPPSSMSDVAERYGKVFAQVLQRWKQAQQNKANFLSDPADEALRQVLCGSDSPIAAPTGAFSEIEWFYEETVRVGLGQKWREIERWIIQSEVSSPHAVFMEDQLLQREPRIFNRGNPANPGSVVPRRTLLIVGREDRRPFTKGSGRLELARSIASPHNPLTARVLVNRVWLHHFGEGLVSTPSNFGHQGERPSHPALLDWLARRFVEDGWSIKQLHRRIMLSKTYAQDSADNAAFRVQDPKNRLLWRMSRRRLDFEALRDSILAVSGNLDLTIGGKPVELASRPYSTRRTVYGIVNRLSLPGMYRTFDFASPDEHAPRRHRTTVPQQALFFMNSPFVIEQARALAAGPNITGQQDPKLRLRALYRRVYGRDPSEKESSRGLRFIAHKSEWDRYAQALMMTNEFMFLD